MEDNSEVLLKYQKLALEYSKLKAQSSVLKTAVAEEKSTVSEFHETVKKKDQLIRKLEQEVECLNFRNLQLTKRVSVLQTDLEGVDFNSKHLKAKHPTNHSVGGTESYDVLNVELQSRIEENERLHQQLYSLENGHKTEIAELTSTIEKLQLDLVELQQKFQDKVKEQESFISSLQKEKIKMQVSLKNQEIELKERKMNDETIEKDIFSIKEDLTQQLEDAKSVINDKILFNDTKVRHMNSLNAPIIQKKRHSHLVSLMIKVESFILDFTRQLSDLYTFLLQRLCMPSCDTSIKAITTKLDQLLRESIPCIKVIPVNFEKLVNAIKDESIAWDNTSLFEFNNSFKNYVLHLDKVLPYLILRIESKESWIGSSPKSIELSPKLVSLSKKITLAFQTFQRYMQLLAAIGSTTKETDTNYATQPTILKKILQSLKSMYMLFDESRKLFGSKIAADHQLPMFSDSEKSTDECIVSTLVSLSSILKKIIELVEKDLNSVSPDVWFKPRNSSKRNNVIFHPYVWQYKEKGSKYVQHISQNEEQSIPYEIALKNHKTLRDNADNQENLAQQLEQYRNKLMKLEMDKENWMLECQLMKAKESQNSVTTNSGDLTAYGSDEIHSYVKNTVNQLIKQIQFADSKSIAFRNECETLHQRLKMNAQKSEILEKEVVNSKEIIDLMKEEQKTLTQSYEDQLNTMSEHLANLNETLTTQKDEIENLKQANKGNKKGRNK